MQLIKHAFAVSPGRYLVFDIWRGFAFINMAIYHFFIFASQYHVIDSTINDGGLWKIYQKSIAGSFFLLVGISLYLAHQSNTSIDKQAKRLAQLLLCSITVTISSIILYPSSIISFGVLHSISACYVFCIVLQKANLARFAIPLGILFGFVFIYCKDDYFNHPFLYWLGLSTNYISAFDFQPFIPSVAIVLIGLGMAEYATKRGEKIFSTAGLFTTSLASIGQHTLLLYMAHVPLIIVLMEILTGVGRYTRL
ncbi:MAG: DUF1624 domain-containing protein [Proteobacteria bacterium]|jgi:uncharacterized membrane protein|nr:DUF1624 domain-containing protein [Pseudomonadota bacterium]